MSVLMDNLKNMQLPEKECSMRSLYVLIFLSAAIWSAFIVGSVVGWVLHAVIM